MPAPTTRTDLERLALFSSLAEELRTSRLVQKGGDVGLTINFERARGVRFELREPDEVELRSFLLTFRKFVSKGEDVHLFSIYNILERLLTSEELRRYLREARAAWKAELGGGPIDVTLDDQKLTPEHVLDLFINGWYFHNDSRREEELKRTWPAELVRYQFLDAVIEGTKQVLYVAAVIREARKEGQLRT